MPKRDPYHKWKGKSLAKLRAAYEVEGVKCAEVAAAFGLTRNMVFSLAHRNGWKSGMRTGRPLGLRKLRLMSDVGGPRNRICRIDLRAIMLQALECRP